MATQLVWFKRDLRLDDHPALAGALAAGPVLGLYVTAAVLGRSVTVPAGNFVAIL